MECKLKKVTINYEVIGTGKPILMLHGANVDHRLMLGCMEPLFNNREGYQRIYIDLPGMGKTKGEDFIINSDIMLDVIIEFIEEIIPDQNFLVASESYGGNLSLGIIHRMGNRVDGLFLLCPALIMDHEKRELPNHIVLKRDDNLLSRIEPSDAKGFNSIQVVHSEKIWDRYNNEILSGVKLADKEFIRRIYEHNKGGFSFDVNRLKEMFIKPTLILLGRQDSIVGYKDAWSILDNYPRATFAVLDRAGHNLQIEQQELFDSLVTDWLIRIEELE